MSWFDDWCFYCNAKHGDIVALREHVLTEHPDSIRAENYNAEDPRRGGKDREMPESTRSRKSTK